MKLIFATNNGHKIEEVQHLLDKKYDIVSPAEMGFNRDIPETQDTLQGNALQKARYIWSMFGIPCFADDTGLEVEALNGDPGVYSARYAGESKDPSANMAKLLKEMEDKTNRNARFRCVIALIINGNEYLFEGKTEGKILTAAIGNDGFGYDPIFSPQGYSLSFAQMTMNEKNAISHRSKATKELINFLNFKFV